MKMAAEDLEANEHTGLIGHRIQPKEPAMSRVEDNELPRPCYYLLRPFGLWHPSGSSNILVSHTIFAGLFMAGSCFSVLYLDKIQNNRWISIHLLEIINSCCTMIDFICPFIFTVYYFKKGQYGNVISKVIKNQEDKDWLKFYSKLYSLMSVVLWILCFLFFFFHWKCFFRKTWHWPVYAATTAYITGCWAIWLSVYGYVCEAHCVEIQRFAADVKETYQSSNMTDAAEKQLLDNLLEKHLEMQDSLERTQSDFNTMISLAVAYHVFDIIIFSCAYWHGEFGPSYQVYQYLGTLTFDMSSILIKVFPAGKVAKEAQQVTWKIAKQCTPDPRPDHENHGLSKQRLEYFHYAAICNQDLGFRILGVRITVNIALAIIVTVVTATISFTAAIIPRLQYHS